MLRCPEVVISYLPVSDRREDFKTTEILILFVTTVTTINGAH